MMLKNKKENNRYPACSCNDYKRRIKIQEEQENEELYHLKGGIFNKRNRPNRWLMFKVLRSLNIRIYEKGWDF